MGRVVVAGAINMDLIGKAARLPRIHETLIGDTFAITPGGKAANQAIAARRSGAATTLLGSVGADHFGGLLQDFLADENLELRIVVHEAASGVALVIVGAEGENAILVLPGANDLNSATQVDDLDLGPDDVVLVQGEIPEAMSLALLRRAHQVGATTVLNLSPVRPVLRANVAEVDFLIVNEIEFAEVIGADAVPGSAAAVQDVLARTELPIDNLVVTLGGAGLVARLHGRSVQIPAHKVAVVDTAGAGDCFCGAFAANLALGRPVFFALEFASAAASLSVRTIGAAPSMPGREDVLTFLAAR